MPTALIKTGLERFARLAERPDGAISLSAYQAQGMKPAQEPPGSDEITSHTPR